MTRPLSDILRNDRYDESQLSGDGLRFGDPRLPARFWEKVVVNDNGCWVWTGATRGKRTGYGAFNTGAANGSRIVATHQLAYAATARAVDRSLVLDHLCRNRLCCNPAHLEQVSHRTNILRGASLSAANANKTHCDSGHEFTPENTFHYKRGGRECRACMRANQRALKVKRGAWARHEIDSYWHRVVSAERRGSVVTVCRGRWPWADRYFTSVSPPESKRCSACLTGDASSAPSSNPPTSSHPEGGAPITREFDTSDVEVES